MLAHSGGVDEHNEGGSQDSFGYNEVKSSSPAVSPARSVPGFASNFVAREYNTASAEKQPESALASVWNVDIKRSDSPDIPLKRGLSSSYDEIDMKQQLSIAEDDPKVQSKDSRLSTRSQQSGQNSIQAAGTVEYSGRVSYQVAVDEDSDLEDGLHHTPLLPQEEVPLRRSSSEVSTEPKDQPSESPGGGRPKSEKKLSFFARALQGIMGESSSNVSEKYKTEDSNEAVDSAVLDLEGGSSDRDHLFMRSNSSTENAAKASFRRGSTTKAEVERELTRKKSIRNSKALAEEAMEKFKERRASQSFDVEVQEETAVAMTSNDDIEHQLGGGGEPEEKPSGKGGATSDSRKSNRQKMAGLL